MNSIEMSDYKLLKHYPEYLHRCRVRRPNFSKHLRKQHPAQELGL